MLAPARCGLGILVAAQLGACGSSGTTEPVRATATAAAAVTTTATTPSDPQFAFTAEVLPQSVRRRVRGSSWRRGCPVGLDGLRLIRMSHWGFDRRVRRGVMIVNATVVADVQTVFQRLFDARFPIRKMRLVDDYRADDYASIEADNTSSFNCRRATGSTRWSQHAYGRAIDINPIENPYVYANGTTSHRASRPYLDRSRYRRGMAVRRRVLVKAFDTVGWGWGGRWAPARDYQHFSSTGR